MDFADKGTDGNGDPFYPIFTTKPDAMTVWVKFKGNVKEHPYATVKAILANDKVQDPEIDDYKKMSLHEQQTRRLRAIILHGRNSTSHLNMQTKTPLRVCS